MEKKLEDMIAEIDAELEKLEKIKREITPEEKEISKCIKETLTKRNIKFECTPDVPRKIDITFTIENKFFHMRIYVCDRKINLEIIFPFRVQCNSVAIVSLFITQFNLGKAFTHLNLDINDGELTMGYTYMLDNATEFNENYFEIYMDSLIVCTLEIYSKLHQLAVGKVSRDVWEYWEALLKRSLAVNDEDEFADDVEYGSMKLKNEILLKNMKNEEQRFPSFEEFMRMNSGGLEPETEKGVSEEDINIPFEDLNDSEEE